MSNRFHLAIEGGDLAITASWYVNVLGCTLDMKEEGKWQDVDFFGNELTLHATEHRTSKGPERQRHSVDMGEVCVPHFGIHLSNDDFQEVKQRIEASDFEYLDKPYRRFKGTKFEQETFFVEDPNGNVLEIKTMSNPEVLFETAS